jgi:hypothetical protein
MVQSYVDPAVPMLTTPALGMGGSMSKKFISSNRGGGGGALLLPKLEYNITNNAAVVGASAGAGASADASISAGTGEETAGASVPMNKGVAGSSGGDTNAKKKKNKKAQVTYLNVHAGLSVGVMAGLDIGSHDRFEVSVK